MSHSVRFGIGIWNGIGGYAHLHRNHHLEQIGRITDVSRDDVKRFFDGRILVGQHVETIAYVVEFLGFF